MILKEMFDDLFTIYSSLDPPPIQRKQSNLTDFNLKEPSPQLYNSSTTPTISSTNINWDTEQNDPFKFKTDEPQFTPPEPKKQEQEPIKANTKSNGAFSDKKEFIQTLNSTYKQVLQEHELDPNYSSILTASAALESAWGKKVSGNFNYGGVKGKTGSVKSTIDYVNGQYVRRNQTFRDFNSVKDYCNFVVNLLSNKRYNAFKTHSASNPFAFWRHVLDAGYGGGDEAGKTRYMNSVRSIHNTISQ